MSRDPRLFLDDIQQACHKILRYTSGISYQDFCRNEMLYDATLRNLEIIGEAARHLPADFQEKYASIDWRGMTAFRNIIAHEYFGMDDEIIWDIITGRIPALAKAIDDILSQLSAA